MIKEGEGLYPTVGGNNDDDNMTQFLNIPILKYYSKLNLSTILH